MLPGRSDGDPDAHQDSLILYVFSAQTRPAPPGRRVQTAVSCPPPSTSVRIPARRQRLYRIAQGLAARLPDRASAQPNCLNPLSRSHVPVAGHIRQRFTQRVRGAPAAPGRPALRFTPSSQGKSCALTRSWLPVFGKRSAARDLSETDAAAHPALLYCHRAPARAPWRLDTIAS